MRRPTPTKVFSHLGMMVIGIGLFGFGCENPFSMRRAEPPVSDRPDWMPAHSSGQLLDNFLSAIVDKNPERYRRCLVDTAYSDRQFTFLADPAVFQTHAAMFAAWTVERELAAMRQVFSLVPKDSLCRLVFTDIVRELVGSDTAVTIRQYRLEVPHLRIDIPTRYEGQIILRMAEDRRGEWVIYRWEDRSTSPDRAPWSLLKVAVGG